tara:strand:+ start:158 stop:274 length:117 start_codon:yes stop_codon:yes gene_type:complete
MDYLIVIVIIVAVFLFIKVFIDRWKNKEDEHYSKTVDK